MTVTPSHRSPEKHEQAPAHASTVPQTWHGFRTQRSVWSAGQSGDRDPPESGSSEGGSEDKGWHLASELPGTAGPRRWRLLPPCLAGALEQTSCLLSGFVARGTGHPRKKRCGICVTSQRCGGADWPVRHLWGLRTTLAKGANRVVRRRSHTKSLVKPHP